MPADGTVGPILSHALSASSAKLAPTPAPLSHEKPARFGISRHRNPRAGHFLISPLEHKVCDAYVIYGVAPGQAGFREMQMNPSDWKPEHRIALLVAAVASTGIGLFAGIERVDSSSHGYWLWIGLWGVAGAVMGAIGGFMAQLLRSRNSR